jgi:hypothetical protein
MSSPTPDTPNTSTVFPALILKRLRRRLRRVIFRYPALYLPLRRMHRPDTVVTRATQLVIEGFPRCGNTFAEFALRHAQSGPVKLAHHSHAPAQVHAAAKMGIPILVVYREPDAAVRSLLAMNPEILTAAAAFEEYVAYYNGIAPCRSSVVMASFDDVTKRMDRVVEALNAKFGLSLAPFKHTPEDEAAVFKMMDERGRAVTSTANGLSLSNPNRSRVVAERGREMAAEAICAPEASNARRSAIGVFHLLNSDIT